MTNKIICIGNRLVVADSAGPAVYDWLATRGVPSHTQLIEGGISGLNLLCHLENAATVVFVDAVCGFTDPGTVVLLTREQILDDCHSPVYDHFAGVAYLLAMLPRVCDGPLPRAIFLVGIEGAFPPQTLEQAAEMALTLTRKNPVTQRHP